MEDRDKALNDYLRLCKAGGSKSFLGLVETAHLTSPFEDGCLKSFMGVIDNWLDNFDDTSVN
jgi:oligoendopeptidase F